MDCSTFRWYIDAAMNCTSQQVKASLPMNTGLQTLQPVLELEVVEVVWAM